MKKSKTINHNASENTDALSRRKFIKMSGAGVAMLTIPNFTTLAFQPTNIVRNKPKIVWVLLRGALDSLHAVVPTFDQQYKVLRPKLASSFKDALLPLEQGYALHPSLKNFYQWYQDGALLPVVAVSSGYQKRSHFDGQDFLESGKKEIEHDSGWLARAIDIKNKKALAISHTVPISLRSSNQVNTWYPSKLKQADDDIYAALGKLYQHDESLKENLESGLETRELIEQSGSKEHEGQFIDLTKACAKLMLGDKGVDSAMLELAGWDTHNNQGVRLEKKLSELDKGLAQLKIGLGDEWQNTVIIISTEFGRTAKENGTGGTDHGTASALFLAGGAINGGRVEGTWPGLQTEELYQQRDLMPTSNSFGWIGNVLSQHWGFTEQELKQVFPSVTAYNESLLLKA